MLHNLPVPPAQQHPIACQLFDPNWPVHDMGHMSVECPFCHALHWMAERLSKSSDAHPKFGMCCISGKVDLPHLPRPPPELYGLLTNQDSISKNFRKHIRSYNNALAMTSIGCKLDDSVNNGGGPY